MAKKMNKKELIAVLVDTYGYEKDDIKMLTNAKLEAMIKQEEADAEQFEVEETIIVAKDQRIKDDDLVVVMSGLEGTLVHRSESTGRVWRFTKFGQTVKLPYAEILTIRNNSPKVFDQGWMIILNRQIQEDFGLIEKYKNIITPENINVIFNKSVDELEAFIDALPEGMKTTFFAKARNLYETKKLDSKRMIDCIESKFGISLEDNAPLSDII